MARPQKIPWKIHWTTYNNHGHLLADFVTDSGKRIRLRTQTKFFDDALAIANGKITALKAPIESTEAHMTLKQAMSQISEEVWQYQKDWKKRNNEASNIVSHFGQNFLLKDLLNDKINLYEQSLRKIGNSGATINRKMAILKTLCNRAYKVWNVLDRVPVFPHHKEKKGGHKRKISFDELTVIIVNSGYMHGMLFRLMFESGMRVSECFNLKLEQLSRKDKTIKIYDSKAGEDETVLVPTGIFEMLHDWLCVHKEIRTDESKIRTQWNKGRAKLGLMKDLKFTPGALRHTFALQLIEEGRPAPIVQAYLRHNTIITTQHYFKQTQADLLRIRDERENSE